MKKNVNILLALLFVASVVLTGCSKEEPLTPHNGGDESSLELRGGDGEPTGDKDKNNGGITDPGDDDDDEGGTAVLSAK